MKRMLPCLLVDPYNQIIQRGELFFQMSDFDLRQVAAEYAIPASTLLQIRKAYHHSGGIATIEAWIAYSDTQERCSLQFVEVLDPATNKTRIVVVSSSLICDNFVEGAEYLMKMSQIMRLAMQVDTNTFNKGTSNQLMRTKIVITSLSVL